MEQPQTTHIGMRDYVSGKLWGKDCVCVLSRVGKVAAATTVAMLIERFKVTHIVFTGVAGSVDPKVKVGDIVVAESLVQHDLNAEPLFPRFQVPLLALSHFATDKGLTDNMMRAVATFIELDYAHEIAETDRHALKLTTPSLHHGLISSGDQFIHNKNDVADLKALLPEVLAVEMEGAAIAQVCFEFGLPFTIVRTISDGANENAAMNFVHFIDHVAAHYAFHIIKRFCQQS